MDSEHAFHARKKIRNLVCLLRNAVFLPVIYREDKISPERVPESQSGLRVDLHHLFVLLTDLETVRDFMLEPEYKQEEATADAVRQIQVAIYRL